MRHADIQLSSRAHDRIAPEPQQILVATPLAVLTLDASDHVTGIDSAAALLFGVPESAVLGQPVTMLLPDFVRRTCVNVRAYGLHHGGVRIPIGMSISMLKSFENETCVVLLQEAAVANRHEEALEEVRQKLRLAIEGIAGFAWTADSSGRLKYTNEGMLEYLGLPMTTLEGAGWVSVIHPDDTEDLVQRWQRAIQSGVRHDATARIRRADGVHRWFRVIGIPLRDGGGMIQGWYGVAIDIDDQRHAEEALKESEHSLRVLVDAIPAMLCVTSASGEVEYVNKPVLDLIGCGLEVFKNLGWKSIIHPDDSEGLAGQWMAAVQAGVAFKAEYRQRYADGSYRWWQCLVKPLRNDADEIIRWYGVMVDVNDQRETEFALRTSEERLREMVDAVPGMLCVCAPDGSLEYVNQPMRELIGHPLEESNNFGWVSTIHPADRPALLGRWTAAVQSKRLLDCEYRRLTSDGRYRWFHLRMKPQFHATGAIRRWYALITDVDDRIAAQEAQRAGERQLRRLMESIPIGIWCAGPDGEITFVNQHLANYKHIHLDQIRADKYQFLHPEDRPVAQLAWAHSVATGETFSMLHRTRRADGVYRWHQSRAEAQRDEHGSIVQWYGYQIDIHDYKSAEDALRSSQARLARAAKAATVAELSASIAHEINQPLAAIVANGYACQRWLATEPASIEKAKFTAGLVVRDANAAAQIVDRIRALFKRTEPSRVALEMNDVIAEVCELLGDDVRRRTVVLNLDLAPNLPPVLADRTQIQQVVLNLMRNAMEAMESTTKRPNGLSIRSFEHGSNVVVQICDEGPGIADLEQIFEPFFTTKRTGLGMGLQICRSIVDAHEGKIFAVRNEGMGVTFEFRLPVQRGDLP